MKKSFKTEMKLGIKDVSTKYNLSMYTIRYYEKIGLYKVPRDLNGIRVFDKDTLLRINAIAHYRKAGLNIKQIQYIFNTPTRKEEHIKTFLQTKERLLKQLNELKETVEFLDYKIDYHKRNLSQKDAHESN